LPREAGIALGPILFIIAILAILAAAIAAGSGSFNASTNTEGNKAKASAVIQVGDNLKVGMDRLTMENGIAYNGWTTSPSNTSSTCRSVFTDRRRDCSAFYLYGGSAGDGQLVLSTGFNPRPRHLERHQRQYDPAGGFEYNFGRLRRNQQPRQRPGDSAVGQ
jgi:hypothetical protein